MIREFFQDIFFSRKRHLQHRNFQPQMLMSDELHAAYARDGYVLIPNAVTPEELQSFLALFADIRSRKAYEQYDHYRNSFAFKDAGLKNYIREQTLEIAQPLLARIVHTDRVLFPLGGGFCINPPHAKRGSPPHQDPTMIDETTSYSMTIWIALTDTNRENGCLHVVKGSHLWGNIHRSVTMTWAFDKFRDSIWEHMLPIEMKAGDILCFDVSTIHGSTPNTSDDNRLAINFVTFPKGMQMLNYFPVHTGKFSSTVEQYHIDSNYFLEESQFEKPSARYPKTATLELNNYYSEKNIRDLMAEQESGTHP